MKHIAIIGGGQPSLVQACMDQEKPVVSPKTTHQYIDIYKHQVKMQQVKDYEVVVIDGATCFSVSPDCVNYYPIPYPVPRASTYNPQGRSIDNVICYLRFAKL